MLRGSRQPGTRGWLVCLITVYAAARSTLLYGINRVPSHGPGGSDARPGEHVWKFQDWFVLRLHQLDYKSRANSVHIRNLTLRAKKRAAVSVILKDT